MNTRQIILPISALLSLLVVQLSLVQFSLAQAPPPQPSAQSTAQPTPQQRVAMLKQWMQASQGQLRAYQWIETTVITLNGEEKSRTQNSVYYGADGGIQKVPIAGNDAGGDSGPRGPLRKKLAENKKAELTDYMKAASALVHSYVPPDQNLIQQAVNAGKLAVNMIEPGRRVRLEFGNYLKAGDSLGIDIELPTNRLLGMQVSSYLDTPQDAVTLNVTMGVLPDGTIYTAQTVLNAPTKEMTVTVENTGYRRSGG